MTSRQGTGTGPPPTFQVAYGIYGLVEEASLAVRTSKFHDAFLHAMVLSPFNFHRSLAPYDSDAMLLFDYRDDHLPPSERDVLPSFMYAMPLDLDPTTGLRTVARRVIRERHVTTSMASLRPHRSSSRRRVSSRARGCL